MDAFNRITAKGACILFFLFSINPLVLAETEAEIHSSAARGERNDQVESSVTFDNSILLSRSSESIVELRVIEPKKEVVFIPPHQPLASESRRWIPRKRALAMRFAEEGRRLLQDRSPGHALVRLEKSMALEASPYVYFYLALAHHRLGHHRESFNFLDVAESWLGADPYWMAEILALRADNSRSLDTPMRQSDVGDAYAASTENETLNRVAHSRGAVEAGSTLFALDVVFPLFLLSFCLLWSLRYRKFN